MWDLFLCLRTKIYRSSLHRPDRFFQKVKAKRICQNPCSGLNGQDHAKAEIRRYDAGLQRREIYRGTIRSVVRLIISSE